MKKYPKTILFTFFILGISLYPFPADKEQNFLNIPHLDKIIHFFLYGTLAITIISETTIKSGVIKKFLWIILFCFLLGLSIEMIQISIPYRSGDVMDLLANLSGSIAAVFICLYIKKIRG